MNIHHHPADELLLSLAAGRLESSQALLVAVHLEHCNQCRAQLHTLQAVGGALLDDCEPQALAPNALDRALAGVDAVSTDAAGASTSQKGASARPELPAGARWPASLKGCETSRWNWMGPGMRWSRVRLPHEARGNLFLLRIAPGSHLPRHTHSDLELTQVLCGSFDDGRAIFGPGDFDAADDSVHHQPIVRAGDECVCLAYVGGPLRFDSRVAALIGGWVGL